MFKKVLQIVIPFTVSHLGNTKYSAIAVIKTKKITTNVEKEISVAIFKFFSKFCSICNFKQAYISH